MSDTIKRFETTLRALEEERQRVERDRDEQIAAQRLYTTNLYQPRISDLMQRMADVRRLIAEEQERTISHPLDGVAVYRMEKPTTRWGRIIPGDPEIRHEGVLEVRKPSTVFAANASDYRLPKMGDLFVRLKKKDGTVGLKFETLRPRWGKAEYEFGAEGKWTFVSKENAA